MIAATASEAAAQFEQNGYLIIDRVFSEDEIAPVSDEIDRLIEGKSTYVPERDLVWEPDVESAAPAKRLSPAPV